MELFFLVFVVCFLVTGSNVVGANQCETRQLRITRLIRIANDKLLTKFSRCNNREEKLLLMSGALCFPFYSV